MHKTLIAGLFLSIATPAAFGAPAVEIGADGLHTQDWFHDSAHDVRTDLLSAAAAQKDMVILFEQRGCSYCVQLHEENFAHAEIVDLITENFLVVQMDLRGEGTFTGFDGVQTTEGQLARKWGVTTTPTTIVLLAKDPSVGSLRAAEAFRLPGYLGPFEYFSVLGFFASGAYETQGLGDFMKAKAAEFAARGVDPKTW